MELDVHVTGDADVPAVVLLHGFPQTGDAWAEVAPELVAAGYRVVVPTQRGYSARIRPVGRGSYRIDELVDDVVGVIERADAGPVHLVGHDWGGAVAWALAGTRPELLRTLTVLSTPHPRALLAASWRSRQALMSWYMLAFQLPALPERYLLSAGGRRLREALVRSGLSPLTAQLYTDRMAEPGALTAALNWYRAVPYGSRRSPQPIVTPTLYVWGAQDFALGRHAAEHTGDHVSGTYSFVAVPDAGHWIPENHADELLPPLLRHLERR